MKDKGEVYILVGEFGEYSARTFQIVSASFDKSQLEALRDELNKKVESVLEKYRELLGTPMSPDVYKCAIEDLESEAQAVCEKFNYIYDAEFSVVAVEILQPSREEVKNGD